MVSGHPNPQWCVNNQTCIFLNSFWISMVLNLVLIITCFISHIIQTGQWHVERYYSKWMANWCTVVESLLIILCLYCIYKCIRRPHNIWRCRTGFLPCARTVLVRCFVYFDIFFSEVNFCVLCCSVREHTFGFDSCGVVGPRVSGMWTV